MLRKKSLPNVSWAYTFEKFRETIGTPHLSMMILVSVFGDRLQERGPGHAG